MSQAQCEYCGQEERYGHNAICVMNTVEELRAYIEQLTALLLKAYQFISPHSDPMGISNMQMAAEIMAAISPQQTTLCRNCKAPIDDGHKEFCGMCREIGCS